MKQSVFLTSLFDILAPMQVLQQRLYQDGNF